MQETDFDLVLYKTLTPLHVGTNERLYEMDCSIIREEHTKYPYIQASTFKGVYRNIYKEHNNKNNKYDENMIFGDENGQSVGNLVITDSKVLIFPVRSFENGWLFITCPYILERFLEECEIFIRNNVKTIENKFFKEENIEIETMKIQTIVPNEIHKKALGIIGEKYLKNLCFLDEGLTKIKIVDNSTFQFLVTMSIEMRTRIRINKQSDLVEDGALFTEEYVPMNTIFYNFINHFGTKEIDLIKQNEILQIGGNKSLGCGFLEVLIKEGGKTNERKYK